MSSITAVFKRLIDAFLADHAKENPDDLFQARLVTTVVMIAIPLTIVLFFVDFLRGAYEYAAITFGFLVFCALSMWFLRRTGKYQLIGILLVAIPVITNTRASFQEGGLDSMYIPILLMLPSIGYVMGKKLGGLLVTALSFFAFFALYYFSQDRADQTAEFMTLIIGMFLSSLSVLTFYNQNRSALQKVQDVNAQLEDLNKNKDLANRRLEESNGALSEARLEAERALRFRSAFLATMSHEIRTPMNGVIGMTSLLNQTPLNEEQREYIDTIRVSGDTLLTVINDILDFSKIESGNLELDAHPFSVRQCIEEVLDLLALKAAGKGLELAYRAELPLGHMVLGDVTRLRQILVNLLNNAIKFTAEGSVTVEFESPQLSSDAAYPLIFRVYDTGIGVPEAKHDTLFEPFRQAETSTTREYGGTGLGLAICRYLAEAMGGGIGVSSVEGEGSVFEFTIMVEPAEETAGFTALTGRRLLWIEPRPFSQSMLKEELECRGAEVTAVPHLALNNLHEPLDGIILSKMESHLDTSLHLIAEKMPEVPVVALLLPGESMPSYLQKHNILLSSLPIKPEKIARLLQHAPIKEKEQKMKSVDGMAAFFRQLSIRILLVEDNVINQKVALRFLARLGLDADVVSNGEEAIEEVHRQQYDLMFIDLQMPVMNGFEATRKIRTITNITQPYIVGLTANTVDEQRKASYEAGMNDFITKPIRLEDLSNAIELCVKASGIPHTH